MIFLLKFAHETTRGRVVSVLQRQLLRSVVCSGVILFHFIFTIYTIDEFFCLMCRNHNFLGHYSCQIHKDLLVIYHLCLEFGRNCTGLLIWVDQPCRHMILFWHLTEMDKNYPVFTTLSISPPSLFAMERFDRPHHGHDAVSLLIHTKIMIQCNELI